MPIKSPFDATAIIMAGGKSSRMGQNKALMVIDGKTMIARIEEQLRPMFSTILIGANDLEQYQFLNHPVIPDRDKNQGPLMGLISCLEHSISELNFVIACDIPDIDTHFVESMVVAAKNTGADIVIPVTGANKYEPLFAVYRRNVITAAESLMQEGSRRMTDLLKRVDIHKITMEQNRWYKNINTMTDYLKIGDE